MYKTIMLQHLFLPYWCSLKLGRSQRRNNYIESVRAKVLRRIFALITDEVIVTRR
jgi:hypothetical protein